jgi:ribonuclease I
MGRMLTFMARIMTDTSPVPGSICAVGVNERTALLLNHSTGEAEVVGSEFAFICKSSSQPEQCFPGKVLNYSNINCTRLSAASGDIFKFSEADEISVANARYAPSSTALTYHNAVNNGNFSKFANRYGNEDIYYILAYSWTPEFCFDDLTGTTNKYVGCNPHDSYWGTNFTLHGLWPQYTNGQYPQDCTSAPFNSSVLSPIGKETMVNYWPNVKVATNSTLYDSFWEHEWRKHGTCSSQTQYEYFDSSIELIKLFGTPSLFSTFGK